MFLINQNNRANWNEWFKCPFDIAMMGACIHSNKTYYQKLNELEQWKFIKYKKGINNYKAPKIHIVKLYSNQDIPIPEDVSSAEITQLTTQLNTQLNTQVTTQLLTQLIAQLTTHKDILLTGNFKLIIKRVIKKIEIKTEKIPELLKLSQFFKNQKFIEKWDKWIAYRKEKRISAYKPIGLKSALTDLENISQNDVNIAIEIIEQSLAKNWQGLFELKTKQNGNTKTGQGRTE
jgi:hypothetical protein